MFQGMKKAKPDIRSRCWSLTWNNGPSIPLGEDKWEEFESQPCPLELMGLAQQCERMAFQVETSETGTLHYQIGLYFPSQMRAPGIWKVGFY